MPPGEAGEAVDAEDVGEWRLITGGAETGAVNMAVDAALLASVKTGAPPVVRVYRWSPACLSFGRNQPTRGRYDIDAATARGIDFVRRPTGGQAVLHDDELTYSLVAPVPAVGRPRTAYRRINEALVAALREVGLAAAVSSGTGAPAPAAPAPTAAGTRPVRRGLPDWGAACFRRPEVGEVVVAGRKLVGSAQCTDGRVILQHGSLLLGGGQAAAEELLLGPGAMAPSPDPGWTTVEGELGRRPGDGALEAVVVRGFERTLGITLAASTLTVEEAASVGRLREQFASDAWTWRR